MFCYRRVISIGSAILLTACSYQQIPPFSATGYVAERGAVRIWRKDSTDDATHILAVFNSWYDNESTKSEYRWQNNQLVLIDIDTLGTEQEQVKLRFGDQGNLSFMQRDINEQKKPVAQEAIALYQYRAGQVKQMSEALRVGKIDLYQGHWQSNGMVTTCEGTKLYPQFDNRTLRYITTQQQKAGVDMNIAWLEGPDGTQLLLVTNDNFCTWQPNPNDF